MKKIWNMILSWVFKMMRNHMPSVILLAVGVVFILLVKGGMAVLGAFIAGVVLTKTLRAFFRPELEKGIKTDHEKEKMKEHILYLEEKVRTKDDEIRELQGATVSINNITSIKKLGLMDIDYSVTKYFDKKYKSGKRGDSIHPASDGNIRFIGALKINMCARYGVNLDKLSFKIDHENNKVYVRGAKTEFQGNFNPESKWLSNIILSQPLNKLGSNWAVVAGKKYEGDIIKLLQKGVEEELHNESKDLEFIRNALLSHIRNMVSGLFSPKGYDVEFYDAGDDTEYMKFDDYIGNRKTLESPRDSF